MIQDKDLFRDGGSFAHLFFQVVEDLFLCETDPFLELHIDHGDLSRMGVRPANRGGNLYALKPIKRLFNGCGIDVVASPDDEFLFTSGEPEIAV